MIFLRAPLTHTNALDRAARYLDRRQYAAMCSFWDEALGNITAELKNKGTTICSSLSATSKPDEAMKKKKKKKKNFF